MSVKKIAIIGATGYTGSELVRLLKRHPYVEITMISSESRAGEHFSEVHPFFKGIEDKVLEHADSIDNHVIDLAFLALPHGVSMTYVEKYWNKDFSIVDLSGDFRLSGPEVYESWYGKKHSFTAAFDSSAYGLPELNEDEIRSARLIANPGCYPTSVILGVAPLISRGLIDKNIISDSKSGITGAGIKAKPVNHFSVVNDNFKAYGIKTHRHSIEIQEKLSGLTDFEASIQFTPHLLPLDRGILSTIYMKPSRDFKSSSLHRVFEDFYANAPFIRLVSEPPSVKNVRGTNYCDLYTTFDERTGNIIVLSAIDNLVKGAAGQAIQNMNIKFAWDQATGLDQVPLCP